MALCSYGKCGTGCRMGIYGIAESKSSITTPAQPTQHRHTGTTQSKSCTPQIVRPDPATSPSRPIQSVPPNLAVLVSPAAKTPTRWSHCPPAPPTLRSQHWPTMQSTPPSSPNACLVTQPPAKSSALCDGLVSLRV